MFNTMFAVLISYIIGSFPTSYVIARFKGIDIRKRGSGNVGATNVLRVIGRLPAIFALLIDMLKGVIVVALVAGFFYERGIPFELSILKALLGITVICGHVWSIFLVFNGGKGVATSIGVLAMLMPCALISGLVIFFIVTWRTKFVSLGSIIMSVSIPLIAAVMGYKMEYVIVSVTLCIIISYKHKTNIKRILAGTENKIGAKFC